MELKPCFVLKHFEISKNGDYLGYKNQHLVFGHWVICLGVA